jgi:hypothetical protein
VDRRYLVYEYNMPIIIKRYQARRAAKIAPGKYKIVGENE